MEPLRFCATHGSLLLSQFFVGAIVLFFFINIGKDSLVETEGAGLH